MPGVKAFSSGIEKRRSFHSLVQPPAQTSPTGPVAESRRSVEVVFLKDVLPPVDSNTRRNWAMPILGVLTLLGAIIRFSYLNRPCLWGDEAMVYWRTCGTYADLLEVLQRDGFGPLHYELQWLIGNHFKPTPPVLRFMP